jgi:hypothetical protein
MPDSWYDLHGIANELESAIQEGLGTWSVCDIVGRDDLN